MGLKDIFYRYGAIQSDEPLLQAGYITSSAISDLIHGAQHLMKRFPTKTCGTLSLVANGALAYEGVKTMNPYLLSASVPNIASDLTLIVYGDPLACKGEIDPQETPFSWKDALSPKSHPNETSNTLEGLGGVPLIMYGLGDPNNPNPGLMLNGAADMIANFAVIRIRQKKEATAAFEHSILNKPIIKQIANKIETDPPFASSAISLTALCSVGAYEMAQGRGVVTGDLDTSLLIFSGFGIVSELVHMFGVDKRRIEQDPPSETAEDSLYSTNNHDETTQEQRNDHAL